MEPKDIVAIVACAFTIVSAMVAVGYVVVSRLTRLETKLEPLGGVPERVSKLEVAIVPLVGLPERVQRLESDNKNNTEVLKSMFELVPADRH